MTLRRRSLWIALALISLLHTALGCNTPPQVLTNAYSDHLRIPYLLEMAPSGLIFVADGDTCQPGVWVLDPSSRDRMQQIKELAGINVGSTINLVLGPDGNVYALTVAGGIWRIDGDTGKPRPFKEGVFKHMAFTPTGTRILLTRGRGWPVSTLELTDSQGKHIRYVQHRLVYIEDIVVVSDQEAYLIGVKSLGGPMYIDVLDIENARTVREIKLDVTSLREWHIRGAGVTPTGELYLLTGVGVHFVDIAHEELTAIEPIVDANPLASESDGVLYVTARILEEDWDCICVVDPRTHETVTTWRVYLEPGNTLLGAIAVADGKGYLGIYGNVVVYDLQEGGIVEIIGMD